MEKITKYFTTDYKDDVTIEYVNTGLYSMLNCSYTSEDPDYGTDTLHFTSNPAESMEHMAYVYGAEITRYLDYKDGDYEDDVRDLIKKYDGYSNSTMYSIERALIDIARNYCPTKWYATIRDAGRRIARELLKDRTKVFFFCESNREEAKCDPQKHKDEGGWYGIKRIDGFFDNEKGEFIIAIGHYGGGNVSFAYVDVDEADDSTCEDALVSAITRATGWDADNYLYIEEEIEGEK